MDTFVQWLTLAVVIAVFAWLRADINSFKTDIKADLGGWRRDRGAGSRAGRKG